MRRYLFLALAAIAAFGASLFGSFHFDDYSVAGNAHLTWDALQTRPLTMFTFWLNSRLGGAEAMGWHAVNLLLHAGATLMLFHVLRQLMRVWAALLAAACFAVHPIQSEAVAYVFARGSILCTLLCLVSWSDWVRGRRWSAVVWFGFALLAKEECVTFPVFLAVVLRWRGTLTREDRGPLITMLGLSAAAGLRAVVATKMVAGSGAGFTAGISPLAYLAEQGLAIFRYIRLLVVPWGFTIDPTVSGVPWLGWAAVLILVAAAWWKRKIWFLGGLVLLLPSSSIFPAADLAADHRMYLPMIAFSAGIGAIVERWKKWVPSAAGAVLAVLSMMRMTVWRTERSLWEEAARESPGKVRPLVQLARTAPTDEALGLLIKARTMAPSDAGIASELGVLWLRMGRKGDALREFGRALALAPHDPHAIANRGAALMALGQTDAARRDFQAALNLDPCLREARLNMQALHGALPHCSTAAE